MTHDLTRQSQGEIVDSGTLATSGTQITPATGILVPSARRATIFNRGTIAMYAAANRMPRINNEDLIDPGDKRVFDFDTQFIGLLNSSAVTTVAWASRFEMG